MLSDPGCGTQDIHFDFNPAHPRVKEGFFAIVAVQDGTKFIVNDHDYHLETLLLNRGDILVCRGDVLHAGASYDIANVRIHYYFDPNIGEALREQNVTYFLKSESEFRKYVHDVDVANLCQHFTTLMDQPPIESIAVVDEVIQVMWWREDQRKYNGGNSTKRKRSKVASENGGQGRAILQAMRENAKRARREAAIGK